MEGLTHLDGPNKACSDISLVCLNEPAERLANYQVV